MQRKRFRARQIEVRDALRDDRRRNRNSGDGTRGDGSEPTGASFGAYAG